MEEKKVIRTISVSPKLWERFQFNTSTLGENMSQTIENMIYDYIIKTTSIVNEINNLKNNQ